MDKQYKYHPFIEGLRINEDGTSIQMNGQEVPIYRREGETTNRVNLKHRVITVIKLVNEAWNGPRENEKQVVCRIDGDFENDHYTNLKWGYSSSQRLTAKQKTEIKQKLAQGIKAVELAKEYGVSKSHIGRIKKR